MNNQQLKTQINQYLQGQNIKENLTSSELNQLKEYLIQAHQLGEKIFKEIAGSRLLDCYIYEIDEKLKRLE